MRLLEVGRVTVLNWGMNRCDRTQHVMLIQHGMQVYSLDVRRFVCCNCVCCGRRVSGSGYHAEGLVTSWESL